MFCWMKLLEVEFAFVDWSFWKMELKLVELLIRLL